MFSGLIEKMGTVVSLSASVPRRLTIDHGGLRRRVRVGDSIAVLGCCLTAVSVGRKTVAFEVGHETLRRTTIGSLKKGSQVNLEAALRVGDPLGGHWVLGHVDGVGRVTSLKQRPEALDLTVSLPGKLLRVVAPQGSITIDGVSLTVTAVQKNTFRVMLIPHTRAVTTLGTLAVGDAVNIEVDVVARYLARLARL